MAPEMVFNDSGDPGVYRLSTPFIDTSGLNNLELEFKHYLRYGAQGFTVKIQILDSVTNIWTDTSWVFTPTNIMGPETVNIDLSSYDGENIKVAWVYDGDPWNIWYWYIDDVNLMAN